MKCAVMGGKREEIKRQYLKTRCSTGIARPKEQGAYIFGEGKAVPSRASASQAFLNSGGGKKKTSEVEDHKKEGGLILLLVMTMGLGQKTGRKKSNG